MMHFKWRRFVLIVLVGAFGIALCYPQNALAQPKPDPPPGAKKICDSAGKAAGVCRQCMQGDPPEGMWTAIGCLSTKPEKAAEQVFNIALGFGGIFILIQILMGAFGLITSSGNPGAVEKARSRIINAIVALLFLVFSVTLLQIIGMQILQLPGMTKIKL